MSQGQLAAASAVIEGAASGQHSVSIVLFNTNSSAEAVTVQVTQSGGSTRTLVAPTLQAKETLVIENLILGSSDTVSAFATDAAQVNYLTVPSVGPFRIAVYDANAALKMIGLAGVTGTQTVSGNLTVTGFISDSQADSLTATGTTQGGALALTKEFNRITTAANATAPFNGVTLPASVAGYDIEVTNSTSNPIQVYGLGADTINGVTNTVGVTQPPNSVVVFYCHTAGSYFTEGIGGGFSGSFATTWVVGGLTAAGGGQGGALLLTAMVNRFTTVGAGNGALLPVNAIGMNIAVTNDGANALTVYPDSGASINSLGTNVGTLLPVGTTATFICEASNVWKTQVFPPRELNTALTTAGAGIPTAAGIVGGIIARTGPAGAFSDTTDTAANIIAAVHGAAVGQSWELTYINATAFVATLIAGGGVTLTNLSGGTLTVAPNSWARMLVTVATAFTVTMQILAEGPNVSLPPAKFSTINVTTGTLAVGNASGAAFTCLTSTNGTPGNQAMRTVAQVLVDTPGLAVGMSYMLRVTNTGAGTFTLATDGSAQFTMTGTMTIPQNTFRDFVVTINTATTGTVQSVAVGTFS